LAYVQVVSLTFNTYANTITYQPFSGAGIFDFTFDQTFA